MHRKVRKVPLQIRDEVESHNDEICPWNNSSNTLRAPNKRVKGMKQSPCGGASRAREQRSARVKVGKVLRSGGAGRGRWRRAVRAAQGGVVVARAQSRSVRGACVARGAVEQEWRACGSGGAALEWRRRSGVRARVQGRRFREEEERP